MSTQDQVAVAALASILLTSWVMFHLALVVLMLAVVASAA